MANRPEHQGYIAVSDSGNLYTLLGTTDPMPLQPIQATVLIIMRAQGSFPGGEARGTDSSFLFSFFSDIGRRSHRRQR